MMPLLHISMIPKRFKAEIDGHVFEATFHPPDRIVIHSDGLKEWLNKQIADAVTKALTDALKG